VVPGPTGLPAVLVFLLADAPLAELVVDAGLVLAAGVILESGIVSRRTWFEVDHAKATRQLTAHHATSRQPYNVVLL
jgi:hypothetical protein